MSRTILNVVVLRNIYEGQAVNLYSSRCRTKTCSYPNSRLGLVWLFFFSQIKKCLCVRRLYHKPINHFETILNSLLLALYKIYKHVHSCKCSHSTLDPEVINLRRNMSPWDFRQSENFFLCLYKSKHLGDDLSRILDTILTTNPYLECECLLQFR